MIHEILPGSRPAAFFDTADCNTGMSLAYAVTKAVAQAILRERHDDPLGNATDEHAAEIAYEIAAQHRGDTTLPVLAAAAAYRAMGHEGCS